MEHNKFGATPADGCSNSDSDGFLSLSDSDESNAGENPRKGGMLLAASTVSMKGEAVGKRVIAQTRKWREQPAGGLKTGAFSRKEVQLLMQSVEQYVVGQSSGSDIGRQEAAYDVLFKGDRKRQSAWREIAAVLPNRTLRACYYAAKRKLQRYKGGRWAAEEVARLRELVSQNGGGEPYQTRWTQIGEELDRFPEACRDKWREIKLGAGIKSGQWHAAEDDQLVALVRGHAPWVFTELESSSAPDATCKSAREDSRGRQNEKEVTAIPASMVGRAGNGRAKCGACRLHIEKGELRLGFETTSKKWGKVVTWHHFQCCQFDSTVDSTALDGFRGLNAADKAKITSLIDSTDGKKNLSVAATQQRWEVSGPPGRRSVPWQVISASLGSRTAPQCRQRWCAPCVNYV